MKSFAILAATGLFALASARAGAPRGVVLVIADGTSLELLTATRIYRGTADSRLSFESMPQSAFVRTFSLNSMVTDSGAAATSLARGFKAINTVVGASPPGQPSHPSILEVAKKAGWNTGVITDDSVTGGTPAPFVVEYAHRQDEYTIANLEVKELGKNCDFLFGGGSRFFQGDYPPVEDPKFAKPFAETKELLAQSKIRFFSDWNQFLASKPSDLSQPILGTFAPDHFPFIADGERQPHLEDMVAAGLALLQNAGKPYVFIVEAGLPDKAAHLNNARRAMEEVLVFDRTVSYLRQHVGPEVLLLCTTDHNTGGLTIGPGQPISAQGDTLLKPSPITNFPILTWATGPGGVAGNSPAPLVSPADPLLPSATQPALLKTISAFHSGGDVWLLGEGPGSEQVHGFLDNTDIYKIMASAIHE